MVYVYIIAHYLSEFIGLRLQTAHQGGYHILQTP